MKNTHLFTFDWPVDQHGYELEQIETGPKGLGAKILAGKMEPDLIIRPKGGPLRYYRPLEEHRGLARMLADISDTGVPSAAYVEFANEFGMLGTISTDPWMAGDPRHTEQLWHWVDQATHLAEIKRLIDKDQFDAASTYFNHLPGHTLNLNIGIRYERAKRPKLEIKPRTLLDVLWLQMAGEITDGTKFKKCGWCPAWFPVGPGSPHRETRKFCSDACRAAWHRHQRKDTSHLEEC